MNTDSNLKDLGFSQYEAACYMALVGNHPVNGSQLSKNSGIARSRIYDVLRNLIAKGYVIEVNAGQYAPLPGDEVIRRLKRNFDNNITAFEDQIEAASQKDDFEFVWTITGYENVMEKAIEMIQQAKKEIYVRLFPQANLHLDKYLTQADKRGVKIRYIAMGKIPKKFDVQVIHPDHDNLQEIIGGRSLEVITDKSEALVGIFGTNKEDSSPINWTKNQWFIVANRDSLRHDFYHCFLEKILDQHQEPTDDERRIYKIIKEDN
jgi:sugar-specific transcriptional regulator TrmB